MYFMCTVYQWTGFYMTEALIWIEFKQIKGSLVSFLDTSKGFIRVTHKTVGDNLTFSFIMFKNGQTYFKDFAMLTSQDF